MISRCYVVDIAVSDLEAAADVFRRILGIDGVRMNPDQDPTGELDAFHFPVGGVNALGLMALKKGVPDPDSPNFISRCLATRGEGIALLGHLVDDVEAQGKRLADAGIPMDIPTPTYYADGYLVITAPIHGLAFEFARHHSDAVSDLWFRRRDEASEARIQRAYAVDVAVRDLEAAGRDFRQLYDMDGVPLADGMDPSGSIAGLHFPIGGLDTVGLTSPKGAPKSPSASALATYLDSRGDGAMLVGFLVDDIDATQRHLQDIGVSLEYPEAQRNAVGRFNVTNPIHGVRMQFAQKDRAQ